MQKKLVSFIILICCCLPMVTHADWDKVISEHHLSARNSFDALILAQYKAYKSGKLPKIADPAIQAIPIKESGEVLIDINQQHNARIQMLPAPTTPFATDQHNAGLANASKMRKTVFTKLTDMVTMLDLMAPQFGYEAGQINIKVFEGLRDIETQKSLFMKKSQEIKHSNPNFTPEQVFAETAKWISPVTGNIPVHATGSAVDLRLYDNKAKQFVDLGKFGVLWGPNPSAPTFSADISDEQMSNRLFLLLAASRAGLINYPYEYWHFSSGDRYAAYWLLTNQKEAIYGIYTETN